MKTNILIAVLLGALVAYILLLPFLTRNVHRSGPSCLSMLAAIDGAKQTWALEKHKGPTDVPTAADFIGEGGYVDPAPKCPQGGTYTFGAVDELARCSIREHTRGYEQLRARWCRMAAEDLWDALHDFRSTQQRWPSDYQELNAYVGLSTNSLQLKHNDGVSLIEQTNGHLFVTYWRNGETSSAVLGPVSLPLSAIRGVRHFSLDQFCTNLSASPAAPPPATSAH